MRIIHFDADALGAPYSGGQARRTFEVNRRLAARHEVTVVTAGHGALRPETVDGVRYVRTAAWPHPFNFAWYFLELLPRAIAARADVIVEDFSFPLTASGLPLFVRRPVVGIASYFFGERFSRRYHIPVASWERIVLPRYRHIIALTQRQRATIAKLSPAAEIRVIGNGADDEAFAHPWTGGGGYVAFLGRLDWDMKGLDLLLDIASKLPPALQVRIAGDGPARTRLREEIVKRSLDSRVSVIGPLHGAERHRFVASADAFAFTSRFENQSLVALDSMAIGAPTVAFDADAMPEIFGGTARLIAPWDTDAFAAALASLARDPARAREVSARAIEHAQRFRWDVTAEAQESLYEEVVKGRADRMAG